MNAPELNPAKWFLIRSALSVLAPVAGLGLAAFHKNDIALAFCAGALTMFLLSWGSLHRFILKFEREEAFDKLSKL